MGRFWAPPMVRGEALLAKSISSWRNVNPFGKKPAMQLFVGLSAHRGSIQRYTFDLLEMFVSPSFPKDRTLRQMREARPELKFSLRLHPDVALVGVSHPDIERTRNAARALGAAAIILPTSLRFTPTQRNRATLAELVRELRTDECFVGWEPRGVWSTAETDALSAEIGLVPVRDVTREAAPTGTVVYTRLLALGPGARVSQHAIETLAERLEGKDKAFVVVEGQGARGTRSALRTWFELED